MSDQNAREQIEDLFANYTGEGDPASEVLAIVREALLSEAAVLSAIDSLGNEFIGVPGDAEHMLSRVFTAAFGADDDEGER